MASFFPTKNTSDASAFTGIEVAASLADKSQPNRSMCPSLNFKTRVMGFALMFIIGTIISMSSSHQFRRGNLKTFAVMYCIGTLISLTASMFLWGPKT